MRNVRLLIVLLIATFGVRLAEADIPGQETPPAPPQDCAECHLDVVNTWQSGVHAQAYSDPVFQENWQAQGQPSECLACHTTGYVANTGAYAHEGVTCAACHGTTPATHPPDPVSVDPGVQVCATCHTTTFSEWQHSAHGEQQLACTTCHLPHPQTLRFATSNELCLNCHNEEPRDDYAHLVHPDENCVDCHWFHASPEDLEAHVTSGNLFPTGHNDGVQTRSCVTCHEEITETTVVQDQEAVLTELNLENSEHPLLEAQIRIEELEAEVDSVKAQGENNSVLRLAQGVIVGGVIGGIVLAGVVRFRRRS